MKVYFHSLVSLLLATLPALHAADEAPQPIATLIEQSCTECHDTETKKGNLDLTELTFDLADPKGMERWVQVFDRVENGDMPPKSEDM
jgi:hypothetical protein